MWWDRKFLFFFCKRRASTASSDSGEAATAEAAAGASAKTEESAAYRARTTREKVLAAIKRNREDPTTAAQLNRAVEAVRAMEALMQTDDLYLEVEAGLTPAERALREDTPAVYYALVIAKEADLIRSRNAATMEDLESYEELVLAGKSEEQCSAEVRRAVQAKWEEVEAKRFVTRKQYEMAFKQAQTLVTEQPMRDELFLKIETGLHELYKDCPPEFEEPEDDGGP